MAYAYGRKSMRTRGRKRKSAVSKLVSGKSTAIAKLAQAVKRLQVKSRVGTEYLNYHSYENYTALPTTVKAIQLSKFSDWIRVFGTSTNDDTQNSVIWKSTGIDMYITHENSGATETNNITYTMFLVQLRDQASGIIDSTGALTLTGNEAFTFLQGLVMLNKKYFKIHATRRFTLGNNGAALSASSAQKEYGMDQRVYFKISPNKKILNPIGDWKLLSRDNDPSGNYYVLVFNNNSIADGKSPTMAYEMVHTVSTI